MRREESDWWSRGFTKEWWKGLALEERDQFLEILDERQIEEFYRDWRVWARDKQLPPSPDEPFGDWNEWLIVAGRGFGKTRCAVEYIVDQVNNTPFPLRIAIVGQGKDDIRTVMVEGQSGFLNVSPTWNMCDWSPSAGGGVLSWPNGCQAFVYSAEDTEALRGPEFHIAWFDEPMAVPADKRQRAADNLDFCLRLGDHPRLITTTTPKPHRWMKKKMEDAKNWDLNKIYVTRGTTSENTELSDVFKKKVYGKFGGTRTGRQELEGEVLGDEEGALWTSDILDRDRMPKVDPVEFANRCNKIIVAIDPNKEDMTSHAAGIVVVGSIGQDRYVLGDRSVGGGPAKWSAAAVKAFAEFGANEIVAEANQGGQMVKMVCHQAAEKLGILVKVHLVHAQKGKIRRAEPASGLYDLKRVHHVGPAEEMSLLEDQMCAVHEGVDPTGEDFDRLDALVWGLTRLGIKKSSGAGSGSAGAIVAWDQFSGDAGGIASFEDTLLLDGF